MVRLAPSAAIQISPPKIYNEYLSLLAKKLQCLASLKDCFSMKQFYQVHAQVHVSGLHRDYSVLDELIQFCALNRSGSLSYARLMVEHSDYSALTPWNNLIRGHATRNSPKEAILVFLLMRGRGIRPDKLSYPFLFKACTQLWALKEGKQVHVDALKRGLESDVYVQNTLIHLYGACGEIDDARRVFDKMTLRTIISWNSVISACVGNLRFSDSIELFYRMRQCGFKQDETTMVTLLAACAEDGNLSMGKLVHAQVIENGQPVNCELGTSLVDMYAKCGDICFATLVFDRLVERNVWTWSAMILGLAQHGLGNKALKLFKKMEEYGINPNHVTFLGVLCACCHAGLVEDGLLLFQNMQHLHGIKPMIAHYGAMVDCFGRAGLLRKAYTFITNMPIKPDAVMWRILFNACNMHGISENSWVVKKVRKKLLELEPRRSGNFVILANKYAEVGMWEKAEYIRRSIRDRGLKKMTGISCVQIGGSIHKFVSGDDSQVAYNGIYFLLDRLNLHMKMVQCK